ncbi:hypothetical protein ACSQ67_009593 [Phaseolus vulgaris]
MILESGVVGLGIVAAMNISNFSDVVSCNLCHKHLHGVDIFIYRTNVLMQREKAFCSAECRETHITNYEHHQDNYDYYYTSLIKPILQHNNALRPTSSTVSVSILAA